MKVEAFHERLRRHGEYHSFAEGSPPKQDTPGIIADLKYISGMLRIVFHGMLCATRGKFDRSAWAEHGFWFLRLVEKFGTAVSIDGFEAIRDHDGPVVCVANHMSSLETMVLPAILLAYRDTAVVARSSLTAYPVFGASLRATDPIVVSRKNPRRDLKTVLTRGGEMLASGRSVVLFPQSTRSREFDVAGFNSLGTKLAARAGVPVAPVAVATDFAGIGKLVRDVGRVDPGKSVRFRAGPLLDGGLSPGEIQRRSVEFIGNCLSEWGYPVVRSRNGGYG